MSSKHGFQFSLDEIEQKISALADLEDALSTGVYDHKTQQQLSCYFKCLADSLWERKIFKSQQEARSFINADWRVLLYAAGPGGLVPNDEEWSPGPINPNEIAQGIVSLRDLNKFVFQAPVCKLLESDVDFPIHAGGFRLTKYAGLPLVRMHPKLAADKESGNYLWIEGSVEAHRYDVARGEIDRLIVSAMGVMEVIGLLQYEPLPGSRLRLSIGIKDRINSGAYYDMHSLRISQHLHGLCDPAADNEIDRARTSRERVETNLRTLDRVMSNTTPAGLAVQQACRMYLRAYESWNVGESAMFLAITMEGLMLDRRQKDDLSARLQDSVAYWLGGSSTEREKNRNCVSELYSVRSNYVHNGADAPPKFDVDDVRELTRRVLRKELLTLG